MHDSERQWKHRKGSITSSLLILPCSSASSFDCKDEDLIVFRSDVERSWGWWPSLYIHRSPYRTMSLKMEHNCEKDSRLGISWHGCKRKDQITFRQASLGLRMLCGSWVTEWRGDNMCELMSFSDVYEEGNTLAWSAKLWVWLLV